MLAFALVDAFDLAANKQHQTVRIQKCLAEVLWKRVEYQCGLYVGGKRFHHISQAVIRVHIIHGCLWNVYQGDLINQSKTILW